MTHSPKFHPTLTITNDKYLIPIMLDNEQGVDAAIFQWFFSTISTDLLHAIHQRDDSSAVAWRKLEALFQEKKDSRATHLEYELFAAYFEGLRTIDGYCNHLKSLTDRLVDLDAPINNTGLVLKLTRNLSEAYSTTCDFIQNQSPLPQFENFRTRLKLIERTIKARLAKDNNRTSATNLIAGAPSDSNASNSGRQ
ncbi:hypothetical protein BVRB_6g138100 [Beta vulgaris subsp. vulgaris]|nr:hypothetical protein BVRB_6g138100 [Beta vulgaris subsp. vulgaris]